MIKQPAQVLRKGVSDRVEVLLKAEIAKGSFPGASWAIGSSDRLIAMGAAGHAVIDPESIEASPETIYDVASLTKPLITTTLVLKAIEEGRIELDAPAVSYLEEFGKDQQKQSMTIRHLLTHSSGFEAWFPMYSQGLGPESYLQTLASRPIEYPTGTKVIYSDLGFIALHLIIERMYGRPAEELVRGKIFGPLDLRKALFNPRAELKQDIAATEWGNATERGMVASRNIPFTRFRDYLIWGEVNDGHSWYMGGYAGNAGLFATAEAVLRLARIYLRGGDGVLDKSLITTALKNYTAGSDENRGLGWQLRSANPAHASAPLSSAAFGHGGFTGTSVWVDPERDLVAVLLTNRIHPRSSGADMQAIRRAFHATIVDGLPGS
ncbi:MAG TPA: serine hydrolase domain-containing protein [Thermoanaerobaculia bacterium]|nr:serine hydrolase domain-containing protein [Thermoanaerobaculia bacterium]